MEDFGRYPIKTCPLCGAVINVEYRFCPYCGENQSEDREKKIIEIELEKECYICPHLSLETKIFDGIKTHKCKYIWFCKEIRKVWEEVRTNE